MKREILIPVFFLLLLVSLTGSLYGRNTTGHINHTSFSPIVLSATVTDNSYESYGLTFYNLVLGYGLFFNGSVDFNVTGGTGPYFFVLTSPYRFQQYGYFSGLGPGSYHFVITDALGQSTDTTIVINATYPLPSIVLSNIIYPSTCTSTDGSFTLTGSGGTPPYLYSIDGGATFSAQNVFTNLTGGYYPLLLIKDANDQLSTTGFNPGYTSGNYFGSPCPLRVVSDLYGSVSCGSSKGGIEGTANGGTPPYQFSLDGVNYTTGTPVQFPDGGTSAYGFTYTNLAAGLYHVYGKDANGVVSVTAVPVLEVCTLSITYVSVAAACQQNDGAITVTADNGYLPYLYSLDGKTYQTSNVFTGLAKGNYTIWVKDAHNWTSSTSAFVSDRCPVVSATSQNETCGQHDGAITASGTNGTTPYQYSIDGVNFQAGNIFTGLATGLYTITLKDANGFTNTTGVYINNNCLQLSYNTVNTTCSKANGSITATGFNGTAPYSYSADGVHFQTANVFANIAAGTYSLTMKDAAGLSATETVVLTDIPGPKMTTAFVPASCSNINGSATLNAVGGTAPFLYSIDGISFQNNSVFNNLDSGRYLPIIKDVNGCTSMDTVVYLAALPTPKVFIGNDTILCAGTTLMLQAPDSAGYQYLWQDNSTNKNYFVSAPGTYSVKVTNQSNCSASAAVHVQYQPVPVFSLGNDTALCNGTILNVHPSLPAGNYTWSNNSHAAAINITQPGNYWLTVSAAGCAGTDSLSVTYKPIPAIQLGIDTVLCTGQTLLLNAADNSATYLWQDGSTQPFFTVATPGKYVVKVSLNGCDTTAQKIVNFISKPVVSFSHDTTICITQQLKLNAFYPGASYEWQDGTVTPNYTITAKGSYKVSVKNNCGITSDSISVTFENCACKWYVPNAFTPNNDGRNDLFHPKNACLFNNYTFSIFDRWGKIIYSTQDPAAGWNGYYSGSPQPAGGYIWQLECVDTLTGKKINLHGTFILVR